MARRTTCDGCGEVIAPTERETLWAQVEATTLAGTRREHLDLHGWECLRRWTVERENTLAAAAAEAR